MKIALIADGVVTGVTRASPGNIPAEYQGFHEAPEVAGPGWLWDGQDFTPPPPATAEVLSELAGADTDKKLDAIADMAEALGLNTTRAVLRANLLKQEKRKRGI